ncbi:DUF262 domain-containing protein [Candidatus Chlorohelix sp.]|uniref:GmrSD restriction endonuclease domain-containing protein n=1 Tax=Candidatus Chlorohelix sp. TaxID=3139201 RepID=UPI0030382441
MFFTSDKASLQGILQSIEKGDIQLPDFQRGWVWDDVHVRDLLASVSMAYPIGAVMMLETGNPHVRFKPRPVEGVVFNGTTTPEPSQLVLDGQQRLTSLYQSIMSGKPVNTRDTQKSNIKRWYYLDIEKALDTNIDRIDAIIGLSEDRKQKNFRGEVVADYSTLEKECETGLFPFSIVFDVPKWNEWQSKYVQIIPDQLQQRFTRWNEFFQNFLQKMLQYSLPLILLQKNTPKEAVCQVFEKVNTGGVSLNAFELMTATFAADDFNLREDWYGHDGKDGQPKTQGRSAKLKAYTALSEVENTSLLQAITLLATKKRREDASKNQTPADKLPAISCKQKDILEIDVTEYIAFADSVTEGFIKAAKLLREEKIFSFRDIPYRTQLTPLAAIMADLGDLTVKAGVKDKIKKWYWCGVLGELYGSAVESRFARDVAEVVAWIKDNGPEPTTITVASFTPSRLQSLRTRTSAAYKGVHNLLLKKGAVDFFTGTIIDDQIYSDDKIDIHHIFPKAWCKLNQITANTYDSIINKTPISAKTNRVISGNAPSQYLPRVEAKSQITSQQMDGYLASHLIDTHSLRVDDFLAFFKSRETALLAIIQEAMGKPLLQEASNQNTDNYDEELEDDDINS